MEADLGEQALFAIDAAPDASIDLLQLFQYRGVPGQIIAIIIVRCYLTLGDIAFAIINGWPASTRLDELDLRTGTEKGSR